MGGHAAHHNRSGNRENKPPAATEHIPANRSTHWPTEVLSHIEVLTFWMQMKGQ